MDRRDPLVAATAGLGRLGRGEDDVHPLNRRVLGRGGGPVDNEDRGDAAALDDTVHVLEEPVRDHHDPGAGTGQGVAEPVTPELHVDRGFDGTDARASQPEVGGFQRLRQKAPDVVTGGDAAREQPSAPGS